VVTLANILSALAKLNKKELATVRAAIDQLVKPQAASPVALSLFEAIKLACGSTMPYSRLKGAVWAKCAAEANMFIDTTWPNINGNKLVRMGLERLLISLLIEDLREKGVKVTVGSIVCNLGRLPEVFDQNYPDYRQNQLQSLVLKAMEKRP
jgi:hypothetical protein